MDEFGISNSKWYAFKSEIDAEIRKDSIASNTKIADIVLGKDTVFSVRDQLRKYIGRYRKSNIFNETFSSKDKESVKKKVSKL